MTKRLLRWIIRRLQEKTVAARAELYANGYQEIEGVWYDSDGNPLEED